MLDDIECKITAFLRNVQEKSRKNAFFMENPEKPDRLTAHRADVGYYPTQKKNLKSGTSDVPKKEERVGTYEYVAHKRYTRPMVIKKKKEERPQGRSSGG